VTYNDSLPHYNSSLPRYFIVEVGNIDEHPWEVHHTRTLLHGETTPLAACVDRESAEAACRLLNQ